MICLGSHWDLSLLGTNPDCTTKLLILAKTGHQKHQKVKSIGETADTGANAEHR